MVDDDDVLRLMLADMAEAPPEFRPTMFWQRALRPIVGELQRDGFADFREHVSARSFYVPGYGRPIYQRHRRRLERMFALLPDRHADSIRWRLDGRYLARNDARLVAATDSPGGLPIADIGESDVGGGERFSIRGRPVSRSWLNYLRALTLLKSTVDTSALADCLEIGGGYGTLGEILLTARPEDGFYVNVDIPPVAAVATYYLRQVFGPDAVFDYGQSRTEQRLDLDALRGRYRAVVLCPWQLPQVEGQFDLFANFMSFQEMEPAVVARYCELVQPLTRRFVLVRNSARGKHVAVEGRLGVEDPVSTDDVIENFADFDLRARDSFVHGEESPDGSFRSEVAVLTRRGQGG